MLSHFLSVGFGELVLLLAVCLAGGVTSIFLRSLRPRMAAMSLILLVAIACTPADPLSTILVSLLLLATLACGVYFSPLLRRTTSG